MTSDLLSNRPSKKPSDANLSKQLQTDIASVFLQKFQEAFESALKEEADSIQNIVGTDWRARREQVGGDIEESLMRAFEKVVHYMDPAVQVLCCFEPDTVPDRVLKTPHLADRFSPRLSGSMDIGIKPAGGSKMIRINIPIWPVISNIAYHDGYEYDVPSIWSRPSSFFGHLLLASYSRLSPREFTLSMGKKIFEDLKAPLSEVLNLLAAASVSKMELEPKSVDEKSPSTQIEKEGQQQKAKEKKSNYRKDVDLTALESEESANQISFFSADFISSRLALIEASALKALLAAPSLRQTSHANSPLFSDSKARLESEKGSVDGPMKIQKPPRL